MPHKTVTRSFRIEESAFTALEEEARRRGISLNTIVNQLFVSFASFDRYLQRFGMVKLSKVSYRKLINAMADDELADLGTEMARNSSRAIILSRQGTLTLPGVLDYLKDMADNSYHFEYNEAESPSGRHVITLMHNLGDKFSVLLKAYIKALFGLIGLEPSITVTEDFLSIGDYQ